MPTTLEHPAQVRTLPAPATTPVSSLPFALSIFLSAFLLFQIQLILGKQILPLFGGAPAVWTACLLFFQLALLAGYCYSHAVAARLTLRQQTRAQLVFLGLTLLLLFLLSRYWPTPVTPGPSFRTPSVSEPAFAILRFLAAAIGLPFLLLSTTSPLLQHWFAKTCPTQSPYRLYALSNAGSLLALVSYPFLVEPNLHLRTQAWLWVSGFVFYCAGYAVCANKTARSAALPQTARQNSDERPTAGIPLGWSPPIRWIILAATASTLLLACTNLICQEVAVIPFLWVLPLSIYLVSFILCFESDRWYRREIFQPLLAVSAAAVILVSLPNSNFSYLAQLLAYSILLFAGCMLCHGEAARSRPSAQSLTAFYLCIAIGGALGGIFVSFLAPRLFPGYWEFPIAVMACIAILLSESMRDNNSWWYHGKLSLALAIFAATVLLLRPTLAPIAAFVAHLPAWLAAALSAALFAAAAFRLVAERRNPTIPANPAAVRASARIALALLTAGLAISQKAEFYNVIARSRNFYGVLSVIENRNEQYLALRHGKTTHGYQYQDPQRAQLATGYYGPQSGANAVLSDATTHPLRVGLVGMGVGTLAALGQPGDVFRFYEINPDVYKWSSGNHPYFTYLKNSRATIEVAIGDGRLLLEDEAAHKNLQNFDLLVLDAFSSDAIPMHLLTREAFATYLVHLKSPRSVIAVHISNNTLDLRPVLAAVAQEFHLHALHVTPFLPNGPLSQSEWVLLSQDAGGLSLPSLRTDSEPLTAPPLLWTDDYCNLLHLLRH